MDWKKKAEYFGTLLSIKNYRVDATRIAGVCACMDQKDDFLKQIKLDNRKIIDKLPEGLSLYATTLRGTYTMAKL